MQNLVVFFCYFYLKPVHSELYWIKKTCWLVSNHYLYKRINYIVNLFLNFTFLKLQNREQLILHNFFLRCATFGTHHGLNGGIQSRLKTSRKLGIYTYQRQSQYWNRSILFILIFCWMYSYINIFSLLCLLAMLTW